MSPRKLRDVFAAVGSVLITVNDDDPETVAHEMAHSLLLFGRIKAGGSDAIERRLDGAPSTRSNEHEMRTVALQIAGMRAVGCPREWWRGVISNSHSGLGPTKKYAVLHRYVRAVKQCSVSPMLLERFNTTVRTFARFA